MNDRIDKVITALNSIEAKSNIDAVAKGCFISTMQLQRDCYNVIGYSVGEYIRRQRLSSALFLIKNSDAALTDIAYSCGYSSQQALCREIKLLLDTTATKYRKSNDYYFLSPLNRETPFHIEVSKVKIPATVCLQYFSPVLRGIENKAVSRFFQSNPIYSERIFGRNGKQKGNMFCYELYIQAENGINIDGFALEKNYPAYDTIFAQIRVKNIENEVNAAWDYLYSSWLPRSMFDYSGQNGEGYENKYFEEYFCKNTCPERLKLYLPVVRKKELLKITIEKSQDLNFLVSSCDGINAEKIASRRVVNYLSDNYPTIIKEAKNFFLQQKGSCYTCGVQINTDIKTADNLHIISYKKQSFAVLQINGIGDFLKLENLFDFWLRENGFIKTNEIFSVYNIEKSYESPQMKIYCPIEIC